MGILLLMLALTFPKAEKKLMYENKIYEPEIKTVQLFGSHEGEQNQLLPTVAPLRQNDLQLQFDDLRNDFNRYYARVVHCNYDWTPSRLRDLDFLSDYNEFPILDYAFSNNTHLPYVHYQFDLPQTKLSGNYLLVVYRDGNPSDLILTHRFMIYEPRTTLVQDNLTSGAIAVRAMHQQLNFTVNYKGLEIVNPLESVHVVVRQNQRWDNARFAIKPSFVREEIRQIEYRLFEEDKYFSAGNEFRFVDFRSLNFPGQNTGHLDKSSKPYQLFVQRDSPRKGQAYSQYPDLNGSYYITNLDYREGETTGNYTWVTFTLVLPEIPSSRLYVLGKFNEWSRDEENSMKFDSSTGTYSFTKLLKQGWYNYQYVVESPSLPPGHLEGNHYQTENDYEVFFYYRPFQPNADLLVGYFTFKSNSR